MKNLLLPTRQDKESMSSMNRRFFHTPKSHRNYRAFKLVVILGGLLFISLFLVAMYPRYPESLLFFHRILANKQYPPPLFPLDASDYLAFFLAFVGLFLAAGGGIGGGIFCF
jgi:hypothetical protein